jgi:hypothetical protein
VSAVETPQAPAGRRCPRCGAGLTDQQEWCLHCGAAVGARIVAAPGWRAPIAVAGVLLAVIAVAVTIAIVTLADDTEQVAQAPPAAVSPAPTVAPVPTPTPTPDPALGTTPTATPTPTPGVSPTATPSPTPEAPASGAGVASWPAGESGWTVILASERRRTEAQTKAERFAADGVADVGILDSDNFSSLTGGYWVVYAGRYESLRAAEDALDSSIDVPDAYVRQITPA